MKVPLSWLKDYVDVDATADEIASRLTFSGTEVGGIVDVSPRYDNIVVAEIVAFEKHPGADRLRLCRVNDGQGEVRVVCGASNFEAGDKAPLARIGAVLPSGLKIEERKVRGEASFGMLCAADELQVSNDHSGIMVLDRALMPGTPLSDVIKMKDAVLDVEVTWNRPDCLSIIGIAREVAALFGGKLKRPAVDFIEEWMPVEELTRVAIRDERGCPRYTARMLRGIKSGPAPAWMQRRLELCGVRPISNVVDVTNYVMLECGHPLHAFDFRLIGGGEIVVRTADPGEKMKTLDGVERTLTPQVTVIADARVPIALAGVMGGDGSEIRSSTDTVLLESACFSPAGIRRTSSALNISTESSCRFERGVDIGGVDWASRRAVSLMVQHCGAKAARGVIDAYPGRPAEKRIECRFQRTRDLLGVDIDDNKIVSLLESLEIPVIERDAGRCVIAAPTFRPDMEIEADVMEEVARLNGIDNVPDIAPSASVVPDMRDSRGSVAADAIRRELIGMGLFEIMSYSFLSERQLDMFTPGEKSRRVVLPNPVSADYAVMRDSLVPQVVESLGRNLARQIQAAAFFEVGRVFLRDSNGKISEEDRLGLGLMGRIGRSYYDGKRILKDEEMFLWVKGLIEALCRSLHLGDVSIVRSPCEFLDGKASGEVRIGGVSAGVVGLLSDAIRREWRMVEPVAIAELRVGLLAGNAEHIPQARAIPVYPSVTRDVAMIVGDGVSHDEAVTIIRRHAPPELTSVSLFDIFKGSGIGEGRKSLAYSLVYRSSERTLTDDDANRYHGSIKEALKRELNAEIRDS